jgi:excisionase family DNA binding protein
MLYRQAVGLTRLKQTHFEAALGGGKVMEKFYTIENLAEFFQVSTRTIMREKMSGRLPCLLIRGRVRFREQDVQAYLELMREGHQQSTTRVQESQRG